MENCIRLIWQCNYCDDTVISYSAIKHEMNTCNCGRSFVDLEEHYMRVTGDIKEISKKIFKNKTWIQMEEDKKEEVSKIEAPSEYPERYLFWSEINGTDDVQVYDVNTLDEAMEMHSKALINTAQQTQRLASAVTIFKIGQVIQFPLETLNTAIKQKVADNAKAIRFRQYLELKSEFNPDPTPTPVTKQEEAEKPLSE